MIKLETFLKIWLILFLITSIICCCKDDDNPMNSSLTEVETNADFDFLHKISGTDSTYWVAPLDTFYNPPSGSGKLYFRAKSSEMNSYEWTIGTDPTVFNDSIFFLTFGGINETINATLKVTNDVNLDCFPNDIGTEVITKSITMKTFNTTLDLPIYGKFEGFNEDAPGIIFQIEIGFSNTNIPIIYNFPYQCNDYDLIGILPSGGRSFIYDEKENYPCGDLSGGGWLEEGNQKLIIEYTLDDLNNLNNRITKRFIGQRI